MTQHGRGCQKTTLVLVLLPHLAVCSLWGTSGQLACVFLVTLPLCAQWENWNYIDTYYYIRFDIVLGI